MIVNYLVLCLYNRLCIGHFHCIFLGVVNVLATTPMWVVNTRLKLQGKSRKLQSSEHRAREAPHYKGMLGESYLSRHGVAECVVFPAGGTLTSVRVVLPYLIRLDILYCTIIVVIDGLKPGIIHN